VHFADGWNALNDVKKDAYCDMVQMNGAVTEDLRFARTSWCELRGIQAVASMNFRMYRSKKMQRQSGDCVQMLFTLKLCLCVILFLSTHDTALVFLGNRDGHVEVVASK